MKTNHYFFIICFLLVQLMFSNVLVMNGLTHVYSGRSGETITGEVILINSSSIEQRVTFDLNDALFSCSKDRVFSDTESHSKSSRSWFMGNLMDITLAAKERFVYKFDIQIPKNQDINGSFWSVLMVNIEQPIKEETLNAQIGLDTKISYAIGLLTHVNSFEEMNMDFQSIDLIKDTDDFKKQLEIKLINESAFIEVVKLSLEVYNTHGDLVLTNNSKRVLNFPGFCKDYSLDVSELPIGEYECVLIAEAREEFIGTNFSLKLE